MAGTSVDLVPLWTAILGVGVFFYVLLDGFDLGVGILYGFAPRSQQGLMMNSIAPVWDGNETWLILGGVGLLAAFPLAFAIIIPAVDSRQFSHAGTQQCGTHGVAFDGLLLKNRLMILVVSAVRLLVLSRVAARFHPAKFVLLREDAELRMELSAQSGGGLVVRQHMRKVFGMDAFSDPIESQNTTVEIKQVTREKNKE